MMERFLLSMRQFLSRSSLLSAAAAAGERGAYRLTQLALSLRKERAGRETGREEEEAGTVELLPILFPRLEELTLHQVDPAGWAALPRLAELVHLTSLTVGGVPLPHLAPALSRLGSHLTALRLLCYGTTSGPIR